MIKKNIAIICLLLFTHQSHAAFVSFNVSAAVDFPIIGSIDGTFDFAPADIAGCCSFLTANVVVDTSKPITVDENVNRSIYTYNNAATVAFSTRYNTAPVIFSGLDIILTGGNSFQNISIRGNTETKIDNNFSYNANFYIQLFDDFSVSNLTYLSSRGLLNESLLYSVLGNFSGYRMIYGETRLSLDKNCTYLCDVRFTAVPATSVGLSDIAITTVPIPGALLLLVSGLVPLLSFCNNRSIRKNTLPINK